MSEFLPPPIVDSEFFAPPAVDSEPKTGLDWIAKALCEANCRRLFSHYQYSSCTGCQMTRWQQKLPDARAALLAFLKVAPRLGKQMEARFYYGASESVAAIVEALLGESDKP